MDSRQLRVAIVYLDEGAEEGGIAHPTQDLIAALNRSVDVERVMIDRPGSTDPRYWYRLGRRASAGDIVHVQFEYGSFGGFRGQFLGLMFPVFAGGLDAPLVTTLHNFRDRSVTVSLEQPETLIEFAAENATWFVDRSLVAHTDYFVPLMKAEEALLARHGVDKDQIEHIPLVTEADPEFRDPTESKAALGVEGQQVVTAFGWVRESKGYDRVVEVLNRLPDDVVFVVAGGTRTDKQAAYLNDLRGLVERRGLDDRVVFTGYVGRDEHPTIMSATDAMVFPYRDNRASDALARALSYRLPVVASESPEFRVLESEWGCPRTVADDNELAEALRAVLEDEEERRRLCDRAERFAERMNWDYVAERMVDTYWNVLERRRR